MVTLIAQLVTSAIGGFFGGFFVVIGVNLQSRHQEDAALQALLVEVEWNSNAAIRMVSQLDDKSVRRSTFDAGNANPGWLRRSVWDSQLTNVVNVLNTDALTKLMNAYATLESVPNMVYAPPGSAPTITRDYAIGGWIDGRIREMKTFFQLASDSLREIISERKKENLLVRLRRSAHF